MEKLILISRFRSPVLTMKEYLSFSKNVLIELVKLDSVFANTFSWAGNKKHRISGFGNDYSSFEETVFSQEIWDEEIRYSNPDTGNFNCTLDSTSSIGFLNSYSNVNDNFLNQFVVRISAGGNKGNDIGYINIEFPISFDTKYYDYFFVKQLMLKIIELVDPIYAVVTTDNFIDLVELENTDFWIGWFTYLRKQNIEFNINNLIEEEFITDTDQGIVLTLGKETISSNNEIIVSKAIALRNELLKLNLLNYTR